MANVEIRRAVANDVPAIIEMLADDPLGATRERPGDPAYEAAFKEIDADPRQALVVAVEGKEVVGTLQLTFIPGLSRTGATRALIEAVRVRSDQRGTGLGAQLTQWAIDTARTRGAALIQLTTDATRKDAHRFYERQGFKPTHIGMKLTL
jgi:GNAT superfamily N-acetyltransferase